MNELKQAYHHADSDVACCDTCRWACAQTGVEGTGVLTRPWVIAQVKTLVEGDVIREWGGGPHMKATISIRDGHILALWEDGTDLLSAGSSEDVVELQPMDKGKSTSVIRMLRTTDERQAWLNQDVAL